MLQFKTKVFAREAKAQGVSDADLRDAIERAENDLIDGEIGKFLIKQRLPRQGQGRAAGMRAVLVYKKGDRAVFVHLFPKSSKANLTPDDTEVFRRVAKEFAALNTNTISALVDRGKWIEISNEGQD